MPEEIELPKPPRLVDVRPPLRPLGKKPPPVTPLPNVTMSSTCMHTSELRSACWSLFLRKPFSQVTNRSASEHVFTCSFKSIHHEAVHRPDIKRSTSVPIAPFQKAAFKRLCCAINMDKHICCKAYHATFPSSLHLKFAGMDSAGAWWWILPGWCCAGIRGTGCQQAQGWLWYH